MVFSGLRLKYALDGSSSYIAWKDHMEAVLEDKGLLSSQLMLLNWWNGKSMWLEQGESSWREFEITLSRASMGRGLHFRCGKH